VLGGKQLTVEASDPFDLDEIIKGIAGSWTKRVCKLYRTFEKSGIFGTQECLPHTNRQ
jgi:hypothetical protein